MTDRDARMFTRYYGDRHLEDNDAFWQDVWDEYTHQDVIIPLDDNYTNRRGLIEMLECEQCGECCSCYEKQPLAEWDIVRLPEIKYEKCPDGYYMDIANGCPYLDGTKCSVWDKRPDGCMQWPIQSPVPALVNGQDRMWLTYRVACPASIKVLRAVLRWAVSCGFMILPDLSLVARMDNAQ